MVQLGSQPQMRKMKLPRISPPRGVCATSGWNCTPQNLRDGAATAAAGQLALSATTLKPDGSDSMRSPWLIQTDWSASSGKPWNRSDASVTRRLARPYSRRSAGTTLPPRTSAVSCTP